MSRQEKVLTRIHFIPKKVRLTLRALIHEYHHDKCVCLWKSLGTSSFTFAQCIYSQQKSSAQVGVRVNSVLIRNNCIKCYTCISLFKEIILQELDAFYTEIQGFLTKLCAFKAYRGHPSKVVKLPTMSPGAENMEYLNNP